MKTITTGSIVMKRTLWTLALSLSTFVAEAKVCVWSGGGTPHDNGHLYWTDSGNWVDGNVPADGDTVSFEAKAATGIRLGKALTLENLFFTNAVGATCYGDRNHILTLTGADSEIVIGSTRAYWRVPLRVNPDAELKIDSAGTVDFNDIAIFYGSGEIVKVGSGPIFLYTSSPDFSGTWRFRNGEVTIAQAVEYPFGSTVATVHIYGANTAEGTSATFVNRKTARFANAFFIHDCNIRTFSTATFDGDVTFISEQKDSRAFQLDGSWNTTHSSAVSPPGYIFNGAVTFDTASPFTGYFQPYVNGTADFFIEFNGTMNNGARRLELARKNNSDSGAVYINTPIVTTASTSLYAYGSEVKFYCGADEVLGGNGKDISFGDKNKNSENLLLDLCGHDQTVSRLFFTQSDGYLTSGSITSSKGPATLYSTRVYNGSDNHRMLSLDGEVSLSLEKGNANQFPDFVFSGGSTTGWILSNYPACDFTQAAFPNLSGIALRGTGIAFVNSTTALKSGIKLDFDNLTTGYLRVDTGVSLTASQVLTGNVDVAAGTYCRTGAGVEGATEVPWLGGDGYNGTVTVLAHDPVLVWTGAGDGSLTGAANWGANESPDLTDPSLTLDFRRATSANPIALSGMVTPAATITSGDIGQGTPHFTGNGTLVLGGTGVETNNYIFVGNASLTYNGTGTLVLKKSASTGTGTLRVASGGKVVLDGSTWYGTIVVESGAELEVLSSCGSSVFAPASGENLCTVELDGRLALGADVAAVVKKLKINGKPVFPGKTRGSSESTADVQDDVHFAGGGTVVSLSRLGLLISIQ